MAPKVAAKVFAPKTILESHNVEVDDVSIEDDSGWRDLDPRRVQQLVETFIAGDFGTNILRKPSILMENGTAQTASNGKIRLSDGKATFAALAEVQRMIAEDQKKPAEEQKAWSEKLLVALTSGVEVSAVEFTEVEHVRVYNVLAHDTESNKYQATSIKSLVDTVILYQNKIPGGDWKKTQSTLEALYGASKRTFVYRMMQCAMCLTPKILIKLQAVGPQTMPSTSIHNPSHHSDGFRTITTYPSTTYAL